MPISRRSPSRTEGASAQELELLRRSRDAFPTVTSIRIKDALAAVNDVVSDLVLAVRIAASVTLVSVDPGACRDTCGEPSQPDLRCGHPEDAGARRRTLLLAYALEYALLGVAAAVLRDARWVSRRLVHRVDLMELDFVFMPGAALPVVSGGDHGDRRARAVRNLARARREAVVGVAKPDNALTCDRSVDDHNCTFRLLYCLTSLRILITWNMCRNINHLRPHVLCARGLAFAILLPGPISKKRGGDCSNPSGMLTISPRICSRNSALLWAPASTFSRASGSRDFIAAGSFIVSLLAMAIMSPRILLGVSKNLVA